MKRSVKHLVDLIVVLTQKDLKVRYKSSFLGYFWSVANPLAYAFVFYIAFKIVMKIQMENYALFLIAGLFPWQWFSNSVNVNIFCFLNNASIIKKVNFPKSIIPFTLVLQDLIHFLAAVPVIVLFMAIYHKSPSWNWIYGIPILLVIQLILTYGLALFVSTINLFFRDLERLTALGVTLLFYFTPVFYSETMIPAKYHYFIQINPLSTLIISWRNLFLNGQINWMYIAASFVSGLVFLAGGYWVYSKLSWKFAEVL
ncbi:MAG: ABC transporter permease [Candidatus Firestonebacteria bacterium]|nr:ABC transporter permease [Candidatus Firestonebacteria bacterium]